MRGEIQSVWFFFRLEKINTKPSWRLEQFAQRSKTDANSKKGIVFVRENNAESCELVN